MSCQRGSQPSGRREHEAAPAGSRGATPRLRDRGAAGPACRVGIKVDMLRDGDSTNRLWFFSSKPSQWISTLTTRTRRLNCYLALVKPPELGPEDKLFIRIRDEKPKSQTDLWEGHKIDKSAVSRQVAKLVKNGYLEFRHAHHHRGGKEVPR